MELKEHPYTLSNQIVLKTLLSTKDGLTSQDAQNRQKTYGLNVLPVGRRVSAMQMFLRQFNNILIYILLSSAAVTVILEHWIDTFVIILAIIINAIIGFIQEYRAEASLLEIQKLLSLQAKVIRDKKEQIIDAKFLVPGDIVLLATGDKIPADMRLLNAHSLRTQEAILTGESLDVRKLTHPVSAQTPLAERNNMVYSGTLVTFGQGKGIVTATGIHTEIGQISTLLKTVQPPQTPLIKKINRFSQWLAAVIIILALCVFLYGSYVRHIPVDEMFMIMIGIAVAAIPEGLPAVISVTLALGVRSMANRNAIVRHLPIIESLGNVDVICADKTGTLTRNELAVNHMITANHTLEITGSGYIPEGKFLLNGTEISANDNAIPKELIYAAALNNDANLQYSENTWTVSGDPTEGALHTLVQKTGQTKEHLSALFPRKDIIPFSSEQKYMATLHGHTAEHNIVYVKGAPEKLFKMCSLQMEQDGQTKNIDLHYWEKGLTTLAQYGERVLALAYKPVDIQIEQLKKENVESNLILLGLLGIGDQPRKEAKPSIQECIKAGISVKMLTGDHAVTASIIGQNLGIPNSTKILTGKEIDKMSDTELAGIVDTTNIYARINPEHKLKLVNALQQKGHVVAVTGDGVNDAPALKKADIGIAMGKTGTDVAKETSDLILADDNFASIVHAIEIGRNIFQNIKRSIQFMLVTDCAEGMILLVAMFMGFTLPITPLQILWVNMVTVVTLSLVFAFTPHNSKIMEYPPLPLSAPFFSRKMIFEYLSHTLIMIVGTIGLFLYELYAGRDLLVSRTLSVNLLVLFEIFYVLGLFPWRSDKIPISWWKHWSPVIFAIASVTILQIFFTYTPFMQKIFLVSSLTFIDVLKLIMISSILFFWIRRKQIFQNFKAPDGHPKEGSKLLKYVLELSKKDAISVQEFTSLLGTRSIASIILIFSLPNALPIIGPPGLSTITGLPIVFLASQLMYGRKTIWLPKKLSEKKIPQKLLQKIIQIMLPMIQWFEKWMYNRWHFIFKYHGKQIVGFVMFIMSLILILPIPGGNLLPGLAITILALAILQLDGLFVTFGIIFSLTSLYLMSNLILWVITTAIKWIEHFF